MSEDIKEGGEPNSADFDLQLELSSLVADQIIPQSIAEKLEKKLVEKQVSVTKDQLYALAEKIHSLIQKYKTNGSLPEESEIKDDSMTTKDDAVSDESVAPEENASVESNAVTEFMQKIEELQQKIELLEQQKEFEITQEPQDPDEKTDENPGNLNDMTLPYNEPVSTEAITTDPLQLIPSNPESIIVLMNWLQYLVNRCGHDNLANVLDYYVDVDWISDDVKISLLEYATGITEGNNPSNESTSKKKDEKTSDLPSKDHIQSYLYIQRLKGRKFEKHFVERINGELARITKKVDTYYHTQ